MRRRGLRTLSTVLIVAGALLLADAALTLLWQEPVSALYAAHPAGQARATGSTALERRRWPRSTGARWRGSTTRAAGWPSRPARWTAAAKPATRSGGIRMPSIGVSEVFVEGTGAGDLRTGPGHYPATPLPGQRGHRRRSPATAPPTARRSTTSTSSTAATGSSSTMPYGRFTYRVERTRIVPPTATWVTDRVGYDRLVLSACHPLYSAAQRIVVFARLERAEAARAGGADTGSPNSGAHPIVRLRER